MCLIRISIERKKLYGDKYGEYVTCPNCNSHFAKELANNLNMKFCPYCGAKITKLK